MRSGIRTTALAAALAAAAPLPAALAVGEGTSGIAVTDEGSATHGVAGIADVPRRLPELYGCVTANAAFVDGSVAANRPVERCEKL